jgi:hypothetical protein
MRFDPRRAGALACLWFAACSAAPNPERPTEPAPWTPPAASVATPEPEAAAAPGARGATATKDEFPVRSLPKIATVAGRPIPVSELLGELLHNSTPEVFNALEGLIMEQFVLLEVARLGIEVDSEIADAAYRRNVEAIEGLIQRSRPSVKLDQFVSEVLGLDPGTYRQRLRRRALHEELAVRAYRAFYLTNDHALARMIVVPSEEAANAVQARLDAGEDFEAVAREASVDTNDEERRGRLMPVIRSETLMSRLVFQTAVGEVAGPSREMGAYIFVRVENRAPPLAGRWADLVGAVEGSLAQRPIDDLEVEQWKAAMGRRYEVDYSSLFRLAGEPEPSAPAGPASAGPGGAGQEKPKQQR